MNIFFAILTLIVFILPVWLVYKLIKGMSLEKLLKMVLAIVIGVPIAFFLLMLISAAA